MSKIYSTNPWDPNYDPIKSGLSDHVRDLGRTVFWGVLAISLSTVAINLMMELLPAF